MKCGDCGEHEGSWYNNRNNEMYCSLCVGDQNFLNLKLYINKRIESLKKSESTLDFTFAILELELALNESNWIQSDK